MQKGQPGDLHQIESSPYWMLNGYPWWVKALMVVTFWLGPSAVVGIVFMGMWMGLLPSPITENKASLIRIESRLNSAIDGMMKEVDESHMHDEHMIRLQLATCQNVARTNEAIARCNDYWRK